MTLRRSILLAASSFFVLTEPSLHAQAIDPAIYRYAVKVVPLEYPLEARKQHLEGHGMLLGEIDFETGRVTSVHMEKSTGYKVLDDAALRACRQWIFKPHFSRKFKVPVNYEMTSRT